MNSIGAISSSRSPPQLFAIAGTSMKHIKINKKANREFFKSTNTKTIHYKYIIEEIKIKNPKLPIWAIIVPLTPAVRHSLSFRIGGLAATTEVGKYNKIH